MKAYSKRTWLNDEKSPWTSSIICYSGPTEGKEKRITFMELTDCVHKARFYADELSWDNQKTMSDYVDMIDGMAKNIRSLMMYLHDQISFYALDKCYPFIKRQHFNLVYSILCYFGSLPEGGKERQAFVELSNTKRKLIIHSYGAGEEEIEKFCNKMRRLADAMFSFSEFLRTNSADVIEFPIERIDASAIKYNGGVYTGRTHTEIGVRMIEEGICEPPFPGGSAQGFITNSLRFVDREEAKRIAQKAEQLIDERDYEGSRLFSEHVKHLSTAWQKGE